MARWKSGSRERLAEAAMRLFADQGFERTTVAEIAAAAGLTERTFFRYYSDKPEVLFAGQGEFEQLFLDGLHAAEGTDPVTLVVAALDAAADFFAADRRDWSRTRQRVVVEDRALQERELHKMATLAQALRTALVERGVEPVTAALAADIAVAIFQNTFAAWIAGGESRSFREIQEDLLHRLGALGGRHAHLTGGSPAAPSRARRAPANTA